VIIAPDFVCPTGDASCDPSLVRDQARLVFENAYRLGSVVEIEPIVGGYMNWSFKVVAEHDVVQRNYFVRKYNASTRLPEIRLEHGLVTHVVEHGLDVAAPVQQAANGSTWVTRREMIDGRCMSRHFAVFAYLSGEAKYSWCFKTKVTAGELISCAQTLATYHHAVAGFEAGSPCRAKPAIMQYLPMLPSIYGRLAATAGRTNFDRLFVQKLDDIISCIGDSQVPAVHLAAMPSLVCHGDFHPGNMKYEADRVVALFDFDFCHLDQRMFDIGHALHFFCFSWDSEDDGALDLDALEAFLGAYQERARELGGSTPLLETELSYLPAFVHAGNLFTLDWDIQDFYADPHRDVDEYVAYLQHNLRMIETINLKRKAIVAAVAAVSGA
jgi:homoserine kinase type II